MINNKAGEIQGMQCHITNPLTLINDLGNMLARSWTWCRPRTEGDPCLVTTQTHSDLTAFFFLENGSFVRSSFPISIISQHVELESATTYDRPVQCQNNGCLSIMWFHYPTCMFDRDWDRGEYDTEIWENKYLVSLIAPADQLWSFTASCFLAGHHLDRWCGCCRLGVSMLM